MKFFLNILFILFAVNIFAQPTAPVRMVAEWEPAYGTLIRWPLGIPSSLVQHLAEDDSLYVLVANNQQENSAAYTLSSWDVNMEHVVFIQAATDSHWTRDWGPVSIFDGNGDYSIVDFIFDGYPWVPPVRYEDDNEVNSVLGDFFDVPVFGMPLYFTGGNVLTDGKGNTFSTQQMLDENEPLATPTEFFTIVENYTGTSDYHIVNNFESYGIQHIDCVAKLLNEETVLIKQVPEWHEDYERIESIAEQFSRIDNCFGRDYRIYRIFDDTGTAAYTNSLILNRKVLVPLFDIVHDEAALQVYETAMPGYEVIGIPYSAWYNYDALHCRTMGIFDREMLYLSHRPLDSHQPNNEEIHISAEIIAHSTEPLISSQLQVVWRIGNEDWQVQLLEVTEDNLFSAILPMQPVNTLIEYYISVSDESGRAETLPRTAPDALYSFLIVEGTSNSEEILAPISYVFNYPNPFNPQTTIQFSLAKEEYVTLTIFNTKGQRIYNLLNEKLSAGNHKFEWNGRNENKQEVSSGIYLYRLESEGQIITKRMLLLK